MFEFLVVFGVISVVTILAYCAWNESWSDLMGDAIQDRKITLMQNEHMIELERQKVKKMEKVANNEYREKKDVSYLVDGVNITYEDGSVVKKY